MSNHRIIQLITILISLYAGLSLSYAGQPLDPNAVQWIQEGNKSCDRGEYGKAVELYEKALNHYNAPDAAYNLGVTFEINLHDSEKAKYYYQRFLNMEPTGKDAEQVRQWLEELKIAYPSTTTPTAPQTTPQKPPAASERPHKMEDLQVSDRDEVIAALKEGRKLFAQQKFDLAAQKYLDVIKLYESPDAYYNLGVIYAFKLNDKAKAIPYFEKFCILEPDSEDTTQVKEWISQFKLGIRSQ